MESKKINVLHLISSLEVGGAEKLLIDTFKNTDSSTGVNFVAIVINDKVSEDFKKELISTGHSVYFFDRHVGHKHPKYLIRLLNIIKFHNIDIIHSHNEGSKNWSLVCRFFNPKLKLIYTVHDTNLFNMSSNLNLFLHKKFIDKNIAISKSVSTDCNQHGINKIAQIYNGINVQNYVVETPKDKARDYLKIINVASINHTKKGQDVLIKAVKELKNKGLAVRCEFVGNKEYFTTESFEYLNNLAIELDLENEITFLGSRNDISELLSDADLFVLPSRYEGFGLVVLEAMAAKIPVIVSNIDGPAELVVNNENGLLFENENHLDLADKILYLYDNQDKANAFVQKAFAGVKEFDISVMCQKYCELYKDLV